MSSEYADLLKQAQDSRLDALRKRTADKIPHHEYLLALLKARKAGLDHYRIDAPAKVSEQAAEAILDDVDWITLDAPKGEGATVSSYPNSYDDYRHRHELAATRRRRTRKRPNGALGDLLSFGQPGGAR